MISRGYAPVAPGQPSGPRVFEQARAITARSLNRPRAEVERFGRLRGGAGVVVTQTPGGPQIRLNAPAAMYIQLTGPAGSDGGYAWQEVVRVYQTGFAPNGNVGLNDPDGTNFAPAYESQTNDTTLTADGTTYLAYRSKTSGEWLFDGKN